MGGFFKMYFKQKGDKHWFNMGYIQYQTESFLSFVMPPVSAPGMPPKEVTLVTPSALEFLQNVSQSHTSKR